MCVLPGDFLSTIVGMIKEFSELIHAKEDVDVYYGRRDCMPYGKRE